VVTALPDSGNAYLTLTFFTFFSCSFIDPGLAYEGATAKLRIAGAT
jgi:hypothetical protein